MHYMCIKKGKEKLHTQEILTRNDPKVFCPRPKINVFYSVKYAVRENTSHFVCAFPHRQDDRPGRV